MLLNQALRLWTCLLDLKTQRFACFHDSDYGKILGMPVRGTMVLSKIIVAVLTEFYLKSLMLVHPSGFGSSLSIC